MDEKEKVLTVPYIVYEGAMARAERRERRLIKALITAIVAAELSELCRPGYAQS